MTSDLIVSFTVNVLTLVRHIPVFVRPIRRTYKYTHTYLHTLIHAVAVTVVFYYRSIPNLFWITYCVGGS